MKPRYPQQSLSYSEISFQKLMSEPDRRLIHTWSPPSAPWDWQQSTQYSKLSWLWGSLHYQESYQFTLAFAEHEKLYEPAGPKTRNISLPQFGCFRIDRNTNGWGLYPGIES